MNEIGLLLTFGNFWPAGQFLQQKMANNMGMMKKEIYILFKNVFLKIISENTLRHEHSPKIFKKIFWHKNCLNRNGK
jgi:hypothetical protein